LLRATDVVVCGFREPDLIAESNIHPLDHRNFRNKEASNLANRVFTLPVHLDRLWLHLEVDVLDPAIMPVFFPEPKGLGIDETLDFLITAIRF
jgi:arginase family enzyme